MARISLIRFGAELMSLCNHDPDVDVITRRGEKLMKLAARIAHSCGLTQATAMGKATALAYQMKLTIRFYPEGTTTRVGLSRKGADEIAVPFHDGRLRT